MAIKTAAIPRHEIPLQKDGRSELQELAAALSQQVEQRHRDRGTYPVEPTINEPTHYDLAAEPEPPAQPRAPEPISKTARRVVPLVLAAVVTGAVSMAAWSATHAPAQAKPPATTTQPAPAALTPPTTPAEWGAQAHQRLSRAGRPVDVFACQGAYAADAAVANGALPPVTQSPEAWRAYLATCLPDMSDTHTGRSG